MSDKEDDRIPPHSPTAERAVLGAALADPWALGIAQEKLEPGDFYDSERGRLFQVMREMFAAGEIVDSITLAAKIKPDDPGGAFLSRLNALIESCPAVATVERYVRIVVDNATARKVLTLSTAIGRDIGSRPGEAAEVLREFESAIYAATTRLHHREPQSFAQLMPKMMDAIEDWNKDGSHVRGVRFGFASVDMMIGGILPSNLCVLAGEPGHGKTTLAIQVAISTARAGWRVLYCTLEMDAREVLLHAIAARAAVSLTAIRAGGIGLDGHGKMLAAEHALEALDVQVDDTPALASVALRAKAIRWQASASGSPGLLIIDHLQLLAGPRSDSRRLEISALANGLKALAKELGIPILLLSQLSRPREGEAKRRPTYHRLKESGDIEAAADQVLLVWRPGRYLEGPDIPRVELAELVLAKNRNGPTGVRTVVFDGETLSFRSLAPEEAKVLTQDAKQEWGG